MNKNKPTKLVHLVIGIIASVIAVEGGYINSVFDPGGATKYGITENVAKENGYTGNMMDLTKEQATSIYSAQYVYKPKFDQMLKISPAIGEKLIDIGVNTGTSRASLWLQKSLNQLNRDKDYPNLIEDGKLGTNTLAAYESLVKLRGKIPACELVLKLLDAHQATHYVSLTKQKMHTVGWISNRIGNIPLSKCTESF